MLPVKTLKYSNYTNNMDNLYKEYQKNPFLSHERLYKNIEISYVSYYKMSKDVIISISALNTNIIWRKYGKLIKKQREKNIDHKFKVDKQFRSSCYC